MNVEICKEFNESIKIEKNINSLKITSQNKYIDKYRHF